MPQRARGRYGRSYGLLEASRQDKAYAAGLFDGADSEVNGLYVRIWRTALEPLPWLAQRWGGGISVQRRRYRRGPPQLSWSCRQEDAAVFLGDVVPYLQVRRQQALAALGWLDG
jgi:hypothetical protein